MPIEIITTGLLMGIAYAAPPGAVTAETLRRGARGGFALAFGVQLGSLVGDATYAALALVGLAALVQNHALQIALGAFGALFLLHLARSAFSTARAPVVPGGHVNARVEQRGAFLSGLAISLANPWGIAFWLSLGGVLAAQGVAGASARELGLFFATFMVGSALWAFVVSLAAAGMRGVLHPAIMRGVSIACGLALGAFGLLAASQVVFSILEP